MAPWISLGGLAAKTPSQSASATSKPEGEGFPEEFSLPNSQVWRLYVEIPRLLPRFIVGIGDVA